jgi:hypothetical protein
MRFIAGIGVVVVLAGAAFGQSITAAAPPAFEAADVHVSPKGKLPYMTGGVLRGARYDIRNASHAGSDSNRLQCRRRQ